MIPSFICGVAKTITVLNFLAIICFMANKTGHVKKSTSNVEGNKPAIDKLADFCNSHSLLKSHCQLCIVFEPSFVDNHSSMATAIQRQIPVGLSSIKELLPTLFELYTQLVVEAIENKTNQVSQTDSSNRLYASLKRHPE